jgi:hypothetical protein
VKLVISDAHEGIKAATARVLSATWQRCRVHFQRNALAHAGKYSRRVASAFIATAFAQPDHAAAKAQWRLVADQMRSKVPKLATLMDTAEEDVLAYMTFPQQHRAKVHSTNPIERLNGGIKRRTDFVGVGRQFLPPEGILILPTPERTRDPASRRRHPDGADRGMDRPARTLSHAGNPRVSAGRIFPKSAV